MNQAIRREAHRPRPRSVAALAAAALLAMVSGPDAQQRERITLPGDQVAIFNLAGELRVEAGKGSAVVVEVSRGGRDAGALQVRTGTRRGIPALAVNYPGRRVVYDRLPGRWTSTVHLSESGMWGDGPEIPGRRTVTVSSQGSGTQAWADLKVLVPKGKKVVIYHLAGEAMASNVDGNLFVDHGVGRLTVKGHRGELTLDTGSGQVEVSDVQGEVTLDTGSGSVVVSDVQGDEMVLDTGSGSVRVSDVRLRELNADTGSGSVELRSIRADRIQLDTGSGAVQLDLLSDVSDLSVDSGSGPVTLRVPSSLGAEFSVETSSGGIEVDVDHEAYEIARRHVRGRIGDGRGSIRIESGSGGIRILPASGGGSGRVGMIGTLLTRGIG